MKILILEDDEAIAMGLSYSLEREGYETIVFGTKAEAESFWKSESCDLCILDINLPDGNGYDVCRFIKEKSDLPIIFLTASDAEVNVVMGLELGADDYICKPFRVNELIARIRSVMRRAGKGKSDDVIRVANISIYTNEAKVVITDEVSGISRTVELTALEYKLLLTFCSNRGIVMTRNQLLEEMWDVSGDFVNDNTLTVYIKRLRDKIETDPAKPEIIRTVRGLGYIVNK